MHGFCKCGADLGKGTYASCSTHELGVGASLEREREIPSSGREQEGIPTKISDNLALI